MISRKSHKIISVVNDYDDDVHIMKLRTKMMIFIKMRVTLNVRTMMMMMKRRKR